MVKKFLTNRESQILELMAKCYTNEQIGAELGLAQGTVQNYVKNIFNKLHVHSRLEAVMVGQREGYIVL